MISGLRRRAEDLIQNKLRRRGLEIRRRQPVDMIDEDRATYRAVEAHTMTSPLRVEALCHAVRYLVGASIPGAIVECGVWRGGSMMAAARTLMAAGDTTRDLYLFDTFDGMTKPTPHDVGMSGGSAQAALDSSPADARVWARAKLDVVREGMASTGYPPERIHYVVGKVEDTVPGQAPSVIALLRLDTDWYESTLHEWIHLYPLVAKGGVIIVDDYGFWKGARKATDEYLGDNKVHLLLNRIDSISRIAVKLAN